VGICPPMVCVVQTLLGEVHDQIQVSRPRMGSRDEIQEGSVEMGDGGRMVADWMVPDCVPGNPRHPMRIFNSRTKIRLTLDTYHLRSNCLHQLPRDIYILRGVSSCVDRNTRPRCYVRGRTSSGGCTFWGGTQAFCHSGLSSFSLSYLRVVTVPGRFTDVLSVALLTLTQKLGHQREVEAGSCSLCGWVLC